MFNAKFVDFLRTFSKITNGVILEYPVTGGKTDCSDVAFKFDISKFDDNGFDGKIGFVDLSSFLNVFTLVDEPEVSFSDGVISASNKDCSVKYFTSAVELISQYSFPVKQFDTAKSKPCVAEIPLSSADIRRIKSASSSFKELNAVCLKGEDNVVVTLSQVGKFNQSSNSFSITKNVDVKKNFEVSIALETFSKIPVIDYTVKVIYNEEKGKFRLLFVADNIPEFELFVATNA